MKRSRTRANVRLVVAGSGSGLVTDTDVPFDFAVLIGNGRLSPADILFNVTAWVEHNLANADDADDYRRVRIFADMKAELDRLRALEFR